ncbi:MAG: 4-hydroxy-3-methylbut-2-enyl diphosphate reductase, partial [Acetanaerobacterium sp.]
MKVILAKSAGFCFGVDRAVNMVFDLLDQGRRVCTLGPIIHNPQLVEMLARKGVRIIDKPSQALPEETVVIRSHGVSRRVYEELVSTGCSVVDATCPYVARIHRIVREQSLDGGIIVVAGDQAHPEVQGICGHCMDTVYVIANEYELKTLADSHRGFAGKRAYLVAQTTFNKQIFDKCVKTAKKVCTNLTIFDTICKATAMRQDEAFHISKQSDVMFIIGGRQSSNTAKLKEVCEQNCNTLLIETAAELKKELFANANTIGVTAGASTPACIIKEVQTTMSEILNNIDAEDVSFEEALEQSL